MSLFFEGLTFESEFTVNLDEIVYAVVPDQRDLGIKQKPVNRGAHARAKYLLAQ